MPPDAWVLATASWTIGRISTRAQHRIARLGEPQDVGDLGVERVEPVDHHLDDLALLRAAGGPRPQHLERGAHAGERVADLVGHDRGNLAQVRQRRLRRELRFRFLAPRDVAPDRQVLPRLAAFVEERDDRRIDPVDRPVLGAVAKLAAPHLPARNRAPQLPDVLLGVITGVDDPVILPEQLLAGVLRDFAELVVDVGDDSALVGRRHDRGLVERVSNLLQPGDGVGGRRRHPRTPDQMAGQGQEHEADHHQRGQQHAGMMPHRRDGYG